MSQKEEEQSEENQIDTQQAEEESDSVVPKTQQNPFAQPNIDKLITQQFNDDMWRIMRGGLPCLETSAACLQQLQERAVTQSPLLKEIDARIAEANQKIEEAKVQNKKSIQLSILSPALQYMLGPTTTTTTQQRTPGLLDNIAGIFRGDLGIINGLLRVIGVPFFQGTQGGDSSAQSRAIQISDISVKVAELQRSRAQLAETIREKVATSLVKFDEARTDFQTSQIVTARATQQFQIYAVRYTRGNSDTELFLSRQNQLDHTKSQTYSAWARMRRALFEIKLLVLSVKDAEI
ncbi:TolC family protein [Iningainema tapete]|uniref:TolC family protein n=1 Tax=Iningainema tapete TaxID=2806730 RepID=UPI001EE24D80|nr:TolC family protein [Iningainema tapete]